MGGRSARAGWFLMAAMAVTAAGCASASASHPGPAASPSAASPAATRPPAGSPPAGRPGGPPGPPGPPAPLTLTLAANQKTYRVRVGDRLRVYLRGTSAQRWLAPLASGVAVAPVADPAGTLQIGVTGAAFAAVRPGRAVVTSVRPPCAGLPPAKGDVEPGFPLHSAYPVQDCPPQRRFSMTVIVTR